MNYSAFISHGGGPLPLLGHEGHKEMVETLEEFASLIPKPDAIVVISAHWDTTEIKVNTQAQPHLLYDYYGFPEQAYNIKYPVSGAPQLAKELLSGLQGLGVPVIEETERGLDHGVFVPLAIMYPEADIPCVQISLQCDYSPELHLQIGEHIAKTIASLDNVLVLGSGFSFHNMAAFRLADNKEAIKNNLEFESWLEQVLNTPLSKQERGQNLINWQNAPGARYCHPTEEHLMPLHVAYGAAQSAPIAFKQVSVLHKKATFALWTMA